MFHRLFSSKYGSRNSDTDHNKFGPAPLLLSVRFEPKKVYTGKGVSRGGRALQRMQRRTKRIVTLQGYISQDGAPTYERKGLREKMRERTLFFYSLERKKRDVQYN